MNAVNVVIMRVVDGIATNGMQPYAVGVLTTALT